MINSVDEYSFPLSFWFSPLRHDQTHLSSAHVHDSTCIEQDTEDYTDASGGFAYTYFTCNVTGESHRNYEDFGLGYERD